MKSRSKIRTLLVDDEELALDLLEHIVAQDERIEVLGRCKSSREAQTFIKEHKPDLVILDIQMPGQTGIELVASLPEEDLPLVVFVTAFDNFAVQAFEQNAVDYILKPTEKDRLFKAIDRVISRSEQDNKASVKSAVDSLLPSVESNPGKINNKLILRDSGKVLFIPHGDIIYISAAGDYMCVHTKDKTHVMRSTMKNLQDLLPSSEFVRVHRSKMVNIQSIVKATVLPKGESLLLVEGGDEVKVSRNYREQIATYF